MKISILAIASVLFVACIPELDSEKAITSPRILAVRSVPAEAKPGTSVEITALIAGPASDLEWALCLARKPLTELGPVAQECIDRFGAGGAVFQRLPPGPRTSAIVPIDACRRFGPSAPPAEAGGIAGRPVDPDLTGGYHQPIVVGGDPGVALGNVRLACGVTGVPNAESIRFNQGYRFNENPEIDRIEAPSSVRRSERIDVRVVWSATSAESYLWANPDTRKVEQRREGITAAWYGSGGRFSEEQTGRTESDPDGNDSVNAWTAPSVPGLVHLWIVLRDDRGGVGWKEIAIEVTP